MYIEWPASHDDTFVYSTDTKALISSANNSGTSIAAKWPPYITTLARSSGKIQWATYAIVSLGKHQIGARFILHPLHGCRDELLRENRVSEWLQRRWAQQFQVFECLS